MGVLEGKVAVVTGGTSGIGAATAELFVAEGAKVVIAGRRRELGEALARKLGPAAGFIRTDVTKEGEVAAMIAHALDRFGRLDCLFNNAGPPGHMARIAEVDTAYFDTVVAAHLRGVMLGMKHASPVMLRQGSGSIINTGSTSGLRAGYSAYEYSAAKAAVIHLTRCVAVELGESGIRVNSISPGPIVTGIFAKGSGLSDEAAERSVEAMKAALEPVVTRIQPIPRLGLPDDVARAALYLASDAASFVNGMDLIVDGGLAAGRKWSAGLADRAALAKA